MKPPELSLKELLPLIESRWLRPIGLAAAELLYVCVAALIFQAIGLAPWMKAPILGAGVLVILFCWFKGRAVPRCRKNKLGFVVCISCGIDVNRERIRQDFIRTLRSLVESGATGLRFHFLEMPANVADKVVSQVDAVKLRRKCRGHFMVYGQVRKQAAGPVNNLVLDLHGNVGHAPIEGTNKENLCREFTELLPHRTIIRSPEDILSLEFTADWIHLVARYIIGIAAFVSGSVDFAESQYSDVEARLENSTPIAPIAKTLRDRIPQRRIEVRKARIDMVVAAWENTRDPILIEALGTILKELDQLHAHDYNITLTKSMYRFLAERDVAGAMEVLNAWKGQKDATWHYNMAFLHAYNGDLNSMSREYRRAKDAPEPADMFARIETFICWILEQEPDKGQMHFALGYFNLKIKGDIHRARKDFMAFLRCASERRFAAHRRLAQKYLIKIEQDIGRNDPLVSMETPGNE